MVRRLFFEGSAVFRKIGGFVVERGIKVWTMRVDRLEEADVARLRPWLDATEIARADRFVFPHSRIEFTAAHALTRWVLGAELGCEGRALRFTAGDHGKPDAQLDGAPVPLSFNLSHTRGMVALAVGRGVRDEAGSASGMPLGVDVENLTRTVDLKVADSYFVDREVAWLTALPKARQAEGFLRLWTLKEAFIKATGKGLTQSLSSFGFDVEAERVYFTDAGAETIADDPSAWRFRQRVIEDDFMAAVGWRDAHANAMDPVWTSVLPGEVPAG